MQTIELNKIYNEDCLEGMNRIPDGSVDMVLCDLPYGITQLKWDVRLPLDKLWEHWLRVCKTNAAIVLFSSQPFTTDLINSNRKMFKYEIIWDKVTKTNFYDAHRRPMKSHENILVFYRKQPIFNPQKNRWVPQRGEFGKTAILQSPVEILLELAIKCQQKTTGMLMTAPDSLEQSFKFATGTVRCLEIPKEP